MNQPREKENKDAPTKCCSKSEGHAIKNSTGASTRTKVHSGIKFNLKKVTTTQPFSFGSSIKNEKSTRSSLREKPVENKDNEIIKDSEDGRGQATVVMDTLKISTSTESRSRERSKENTPKSVANVIPKSKAPCSKCSRCPTKEEKTNSKPVKVVKNPEQVLKSIKTETRQISKTSTSKTKCTKLIKLLESKPQSKTSNALIPKSNLINSVKCEVISAKNETNSRVLEKVEIVSLIDEKQEPCVVDIKPQACSSNPEKYGSGCTETEKPMTVVMTLNADNLAPANCIEKPLVEADSEPGLLNGTENETEPTSGSSTESEPSDTKKESDGTKSNSKIPRKTFGASGLKFHFDIKKQTIPKPFSFDCRDSNMNQPTNNVESVVN